VHAIAQEAHSLSKISKFEATACEKETVKSEIFLFRPKHLHSITRPVAR
jgi:hypothetical protein